MNIYLDVNGVLLNRDLTPATGMVAFLKHASQGNNLLWLTTHCKSDPAPVQAYLKPKLPIEVHGLIDTIRPTNWDVLKTDGIDFNEDFLWFDDNIFEAEKVILKRHDCLNKFVHVDLSKNPDISSYFS